VQGVWRAEAALGANLRGGIGYRKVRRNPLQVGKKREESIIPIDQRFIGAAVRLTSNSASAPAA
jgi:hypothetical protein